MKRSEHLKKADVAIHEWGIVFSSFEKMRDVKEFENSVYGRVVFSYSDIPEFLLDLLIGHMRYLNESC